MNSLTYTYNIIGANTQASTIDVSFKSTNVAHLDITLTIPFIGNPNNIDDIQKTINKTSPIPYWVQKQNEIEPSPVDPSNETAFTNLIGYSNTAVTSLTNSFAIAEYYNRSVLAANLAYVIEEI
jgi:hypothetical protein